MEVRELDGIDDLEAAMRAHHRAWDVAYDGLLPDEVVDEVTSEPTESRLRELYEALDEEEGCFLVASVDGTVVGYARFRWGAETKPFVGPDEAGLKEIYVDPDYWGDGVGTALLEAGLERLPDSCSALRLETLAGNDRARAFYRSRGFEAVDTFEEEVRGEPIEHVVFERSLGDK